MKLPKIPFNKIHMTIQMLPIVKDFFTPVHVEDTNRIKVVKQLEDALHNKKAEIFTLRQKIKDLEETTEDLKYELDITYEELKDANNKLTKEGL